MNDLTFNFYVCLRQLQILSFFFFFIIFNFKMKLPFNTYHFLIEIDLKIYLF